MAKKIKVGLVNSLKIKDGLLDRLTPGTMLKAVFEDQNEKDPDAISLYYGDDFVGYLCNSDATLEGLRVYSASNLREYLRLCDEKGASCSEVWVRIEKRAADFVSKNKTTLRRFVGTCFFVPQRDTKTTEEVLSFSFQCAGSKSRYTGRITCLTDIRQALEEKTDPKIPVLIKKGEDNFIVTDEKTGKSIGVIRDQEDENAHSEIEKLSLWLDSEPELKAFATSFVPTNLGELITLTGDFVSTQREDFLPYLDDAIRRGCGQNAELEEKLDLMLSQKVDAPIIKEVFEVMRQSSKDVIRPQRFYTSDTENLCDGLNDCLCNLNIKLVGGHGSGKETFITTIAWILNKPIVIFSGNGATSKDDLFGGQRLVDGNTEFELSPYMEALTRDAILMLDEVDAIKNSILMALHGICNLSTKQVTIPGYGV